MIVPKDIMLFYEYFHSRVSGFRDYVFQESPKNLSMVNNFTILMADRFGGSAGRELLFKYFCYQFHKWSTAKTKFGVGNVMLNWVIGKKAFDDWDATKADHWYMYDAELRRKYSIHRSDLISDPVQEMFTDIDICDNDRSLYLNQPEGLVFCIDYTRMYSPFSKVCEKCINSSTCIELTKKKYPLEYSRLMSHDDEAITIKKR